MIQLFMDNRDKIIQKSNTYVVYGNVLCLVAGLGLHTSLKNAKMEYGEKMDGYLSSIALLPI